MMRWSWTPSLFLRLFFLCLCFVSFQKAWAGWWFYEGKQASKVQQWDRAAEYLRLANRWDPGDPEIQYLLGRALYRWGRTEGAGSILEEARSLLSELTNRLPFFGKGWLYLGLTNLALEENDMTVAGWEKVKTYLYRAHEREKGSAWMNFMVARTLLANHHFLTPDEKKQALLLMQQAIARNPPRHLGLPPSYLRHGLDFLWREFHDFSLLRQITPRDYPSYHRLLDFLANRKLWYHHARVYPLYLKFKQAFYRKACLKAAAMLQQGERDKALNAFRQAYWISPHQSWAKAGLLAANDGRQAFAGKTDLWLGEILEELTKHQRDLLPYLRPHIEKIDDPYLKGLYAFRKGDYERAVEFLEQTKKGNLRKYFLSLSYNKLNRPEHALQILLPVLEEKKPDLRELLLLETLAFNNPLAEKIQAKMEEAAPPEYPPQQWWGPSLKQGRMDQRGKAGFSLNLFPGRNRLEIQIRGGRANARGADGYVVFRLNHKPFGSVYVTHAEWKTIVFYVVSGGGRRVLEANLINGAEKHSRVRGPWVELGKVRVQHPDVTLPKGVL